MEARDAVIASVRRAFESLPRPDFTLADAEDSATDAAAEPEDEALRWWDLPDDYIERVTSAFCLLPPQSIPYYLAAYMTWACRKHGTSSAGLMDDVELFLTRKDQFNSVLSLLTLDQTRAVAGFVRLMADADHKQLVAEGFVEPELRELNYYRQAFENEWSSHLTDPV